VRASAQTQLASPTAPAQPHQPDLTRGQHGRLVTNLRAAGYQPEQVDEIYITHMYLDHVGELTINGQRVFSNATVRAAKPEGDYWLSPAKMAAAPDDAKAGFQNAMNSLDPYVKAGEFHPFEGDISLVSGVRSLGTHGHTPGQATTGSRSVTRSHPP
jgi:glyoxylase-like metal-dependent hydrolase (beta-lactamase superfamily II)